eukprot:12813560-Heterocapsa_arctica.AAC.1
MTEACPNEMYGIDEDPEQIMNGKVAQLNVEDVKDKDCTEKTKRQWRKLDRVRHAFLMKLKHGGKESEPWARRDGSAQLRP